MEDVQLTINEALYVLLIGCFFVFLTSFFAWKKGFYNIPKQKKELHTLSLFVVLKAFAIFIALSAFIVPTLSLGLLYLYSGSFNVSPQMLIAVSSIAIVTTFLALSLFQYFQTKQDKELIFGRHFGLTLSFHKSVNDILVGVLCWFLSFPIVMVAGKLIYFILYFLGHEVVPDQVAVKQVKMALSSPFLFTFMAINVIFFVPILEEFLFRGCLQTWMRGKIGVSKAICFTSIIFAAFHFSIVQGLGNFELLASLFVLSLFLGFIYEKQQSLLASISLHAFFNAVTVSMILFT